MNRILILTAAAAVIALPASAQSIRVSTAGKSAEQVRTEVFLAARKLCSSETAFSYHPEVTWACVDRTVRATLAQSQDPNLRVASR